MANFLIASIAFGSVLLGIALAVVLIRDDLSDRAFWVVRLIASLGTGFVSAGILGPLEIDGTIAKVMVKAGGPSALTIMVYFFNPPATVSQYLRATPGRDP